MPEDRFILLGAGCRQAGADPAAARVRVKSTTDDTEGRFSLPRSWGEGAAGALPVRRRGTATASTVSPVREAAGSGEYNSEEPVGNPRHAHRVDVTLRLPRPSNW